MDQLDRDPERSEKRKEKVNISYHCWWGGYF